ncbi:MAG TPA: hypothetical protein VMV86_02525 [Methanosarcinales archaeon]|nr:hypothetical protein [Methanosarcinales archaeon]
MRDLLGSDIYAISEILDKIDFKAPSTTTIVDGKTIEKTEKELGIDLLLVVIKKLYLAKDEINKLLASLTEKTIEEIEALKFGDLKNLLKEFTEKEGFASFFK